MQILVYSLSWHDRGWCQSYKAMYTSLSCLWHSMMTTTLTLWWPVTTDISHRHWLSSSSSCVWYHAAVDTEQVICSFLICSKLPCFPEVSLHVTTPLILTWFDYIIHYSLEWYAYIILCCVFHWFLHVNCKGAIDGCFKATPFTVARRDVTTRRNGWHF